MTASEWPLHAVAACGHLRLGDTIEVWDGVHRREARVGPLAEDQADRLRDEVEVEDELEAEDPAGHWRSRFFAPERLPDWRLAESWLKAEARAR